MKFNKKPNSCKVVLFKDLVIGDTFRVETNGNICYIKAQRENGNVYGVNLQNGDITFITAGSIVFPIDLEVNEI